MILIGLYVAGIRYAQSISVLLWGVLYLQSAGKTAYTATDPKVGSGARFEGMKQALQTQKTKTSVDFPSGPDFSVLRLFWPSTVWCWLPEDME